MSTCIKHGFTCQVIYTHSHTSTVTYIERINNSMYSFLVCKLSLLLLLPIFFFFLPRTRKTSANRRKATYNPGQPYNLNVFQTSSDPSNYLKLSLLYTTHSQRVCSRFYFFFQQSLLLKITFDVSIALCLFVVYISLKTVYI